MSNVYYITHIASYLPENIVRNDDLRKIVDTSDEWITSRTGIKQRHICNEDQNASDLAVLVTQKLIHENNIDPNCIDAIIVATTTSNRMPSAACKVQCAIGAHNACAFDISAACSGFVYGSYIAGSFLSSSRDMKNVLLVSSEAMSQFVDWSDRSTCVLFGDGASAVLLQRDKCIGGNDSIGFEVVDTTIRSISDKDMYEAILIDCMRHNNTLLHKMHDNNAGTKEGEIDLICENCDSSRIVPYDNTKICNASCDEFLSMNGNYVFKNAIDKMSNAINDILCANGLTIHDVDWIVPHQANKRIIDAMCKFFDFDIKKFICTVDIHANTSAASIPLAIGHGIENKYFKKGETIVVVAFGAGFTYGASIMRVV